MAFYLLNFESTKYIIIKRNTYLMSMCIVRNYLDVWTINVYIAFDPSVIVSYCYSLKKRDTLLQEPLALFMCLIFWLPNRFKHIYCLSSTNRVFIWIMFCILNWKRCVCNRFVFSTFRLSTVIFFVSTNCFCGRYKIRVVYSYVLSQKNLTSKMMPIKARIFWNNIAYMFR